MFYVIFYQVSVFVIYKKGSYLNIGIKNISKIYTLDNMTKAPIVNINIISLCNNNN